MNIKQTYCQEGGKKPRGRTSKTKRHNTSVKRHNRPSRNTSMRQDKQDKQDKQNTYPVKYIPKSLTKKARRKASREIEKSRKLYKKGVYYTRKKIPGYKVKVSNHIINAKKIYGVDSVEPTRELAEKTGCSIDALEKIVSKGAGAYFSSGSRPNQTGQSWGIARLASAITGGKASAVDFHILSDGCRKDGLAYSLALEARKKHGYGTRRVPKTLV